MKKILCLAILFVAAQSTISYSQNFKFAKDSFGAYGPSSAGIPISAKFKNLTGDSLHLRWVKIYNNLPSGWDLQICDLSNCHDSSVDSVDFGVSAHDSGFFLIDFTPNHIEGSGKIRLFVFQTDEDRNQGITTTFFGTTLVGISGEMQLETVAVYPIPAQNNLHIQFNRAANYQVKILDITGKTLLIQNLHNTASADLDIFKLNSGYYFARITDANGKEITVSFNKN